ncbi:hypothetical protein [Oceanirhabdus seepicola]|uniref:Lipoprotein n=1 Tax=Oceanirhabdus seepicola TaxID=2828781 RepID=A0A9J6P4B2_9CLOT|nr:hypothetical protein [Oceanirhabdus seepicola]MCM1990990.1 hypothetical protein [Oceanirhabdus seepicola]
MLKNFKIIVCIITLICIFAVSCKNTDKVAVENETVSGTKEIENNKAQNTTRTIEDETIVDLGNLKGGYSQELITQANLILMVSNQSFSMDKVNLSIYIDERLLVNDTYLVEDQHKYLYYYILIEEGDHDISVKYNDQVIGQETIKILNDKSTWVALSYWKEKDEESFIDFYTSDEPILID